MRYRTKPFEIEAIQFNNSYISDNFFEKIQSWAGTHTTPAGHIHNNFDWAKEWVIESEQIIAVIWDKLHETWVGVRDGDYIIKGMKGEFYPCDPQVFEAKYELTESEGVISSRDISNRIQQSRRFQG